MEGRQDNIQFWLQQEALSLLQEQLLASISDEVVPSIPELPSRPTVPSKTSFFGRKHGKDADVKPAAPPKQRPVSVRVQLDEINVRTETGYGLFETLRAQAVLVVIEVR